MSSSVSLSGGNPGVSKAPPSPKKVVGTTWVVQSLPHETIPKGRFGPKLASKLCTTFPNYADLNGFYATIIEGSTNSYAHRLCISATPDAWFEVSSCYLGAYIGSKEPEQQTAPAQKCCSLMLGPCPNCKAQFESEMLEAGKTYNRYTRIW